MDLDASAAHERRKLEAVDEAARVFARARAEYERARDARDLAIRAAVRAGVATGEVATVAGLTPGRVSRLTSAPRP